MNLLRRLKQEGNNLVGYGASARGNTLHNYYGIGTDLMDYIVDRNMLKHGLYSPGMHIPVCPVEKILKDRPDYGFSLGVEFFERNYRATGRIFVPWWKIYFAYS